MAATIGSTQSLGPTFFVEIGSQDRFSDSLYKTCWSLVGVNFFISVDDESFRAGSSSMFNMRELYEDG